MSALAPSYFDLVERWILGGLSIEQMKMTPDRRFRAMLAYEAYQIWLTDKQIRPTDIMRRISSRNYAYLLQKATEGDARAQEYVTALNIHPGKTRTLTELSNDVALFNHLVGYFSTPTDHIERAKVMDASDWLIREGMKMGDARSVKSGADLKMQLHNNFQEKESPTDQMPSVEINSTGDVSVSKRDGVNLTEEEKRRIGRRYGLTERQVTEMVQNADGTWQMPAEEPDVESQKDVFDEQQ